MLNLMPAAWGMGTGQEHTAMWPQLGQGKQMLQGQRELVQKKERQ